MLVAEIKKFPDIFPVSWESAVQTGSQATTSSAS